MVVTVMTRKDDDGCSLSEDIVSPLTEKSRISGAWFSALLMLATDLTVGED